MGRDASTADRYHLSFMVPREPLVGPSIPGPPLPSRAGRLTPAAAREGLRRLGPRALVLGALVLALVAFAAHLDPEAWFLARTAAIGCLGIALAEGARPRVASLVAPALLLGVVALPSGTGRALAVSGVLALGGVVALVDRWRGEREFGFEAALGAGFLAQALFRPEWVLAAGEVSADLLRLLLGPILVAAAHRWVRPFWGRETAATALFVCLALARGATPTAAFALLAPWIWELGTESRRLRGAAVWAGLVAAAFWRFRAALLGAVAPGLRRAPDLVLVAAGGMAMLGAWWWPGGGEEEAYRLLLVLPALVWPGLRRPLEGLGFLSLAAGVAFIAGPTGAAIVGATFLARWDGTGRWPRGALGWAATVVVGLGLSSAYPWLREEASWWLGSSAWTALAAAALFAIGNRFSGRDGRGWVVAGLAAWGLLIGGIDPPGPDLRQGAGAVVLTEDARFWGEDWESSTVCRLSVESALANGAAVASGTEVGWVGLLFHEGPERRFPLLAGASTGEWAARHLPDVETPDPWIHWVADRQRFGRRYRTQWSVAPAANGVRRIRVVRSPNLSAEVELMVWTLQADPC